MHVYRVRHHTTPCFTFSSAFAETCASSQHPAHALFLMSPRIPTAMPHFNSFDLSFKEFDTSQPLTK
jgi:hypothetical protein